MAQIIMPTREVEKQEAPKESAMDKLLKGLQIASSAFGIGSSISNMTSQSQARDIAAAKETRDQATFGLKTQETTMQAPKGTTQGTMVTLQTPEGDDVRSLKLRTSSPSGV